MTRACLLCGSPDLLPCFEPPPQAGGVTSDCRPWPRPAAVAVCPRCGHLQKPDVLPQLNDVYADYRLYRLSDGAEQAVFAGDGRLRPRSAVLAERLAPYVPQGPLRVLDVGCGNGATLRAFGAARPDWVLHGYEIDDRTRDAVLALPGVRGFFSGPLQAVDGPFDLISMVHVFEHVPGPGPMLDLLRTKLAPAGLLLVEVPDARQSPFDLAVVDHCSHFSPEILAGFARSRGYEVVAAASDWLPKECGVLLRPARGPAPDWPSGAPDLGSARAQAEWLGRMLRHATDAAASAARFGVFGTALAGTWLGSILGERVGFFVDDDPARAGKTHLGRPVVPSAGVDPAATVYLAFPPPIARRLHERLARTAPGRYVCPPD